MGIVHGNRNGHNRHTKLIYLENYELLDCKANIIEVANKDNRITIFLDQTIFYPQGGGQPYDKGVISSNSSKFIVEEVRFIDGVVHHMGRFEHGSFSSNEVVECFVDKERCILNSKLHSAGHVVDYAVSKIKSAWIPIKGYHFPEGPYVEYEGSSDETDKEKLRSDIEIACNQTLKENIKPKLLFINKGEMASICRHVPENMPENKPSRVVVFGDFGVPYGGTHVSSLSDIGHITIRNIKAKAGNVRVGYDIK
ncbi:MAG: hypothetical protein KGH64_03080 [Candidatus Micrarchaeota archaeon]|nr:hypothetical protein [Candidatus Micrarchaeota archaeon]MDE1834297.1 hypothetical protein [Candidatus Micrarchaeota archaeon]MDE1859442.1 hypothetical protein [Candidatus Micrarchaeota archaeon]